MIEELIESNLNLAPDAIRDLNAMADRVKAFLDLVTEAMHSYRPDLMDRAEAMEKEIDLMREEKRQGYVSRLKDGICIYDTSLVFLDMMTAFEKMGDYCFNIAQALAGVR